MQYPWITEVLPTPVHVNLLDIIGNETSQTRQHVSNHQQSNVGGDRPRRGVKLCVLQSAKVHEWAFGIFSSHSDVKDLMFYRIPNIHSALMKWS